jgi:dihydrofolate reductase
VAALKNRVVGKLQVHGNCVLAQMLIKHDLIDEYRLLTFPVLLGAGSRLFGPGCVPTTLKLMTSTTTSKGAVISVYRRAGKLTTGSVVLRNDGTYEMVA